MVLRASVYLLFEQVAFDSDQAINGLMAKHLSEGRAFPLFFYGQTYMLAVEAWTMVPFFWIGGPTVLALRCCLLTWNIAFGVLLIAGLCRDSRLRPWTALVPALFFLIAPVSVANQLINAQGGIIEPFVYIGVLWFLRGRPLWFGAVLAVGFRNREFTIYAVPVLLGLEWLSGELDRARLLQWLLALVMFLAVWETIEALLPFADLKGPGTRGQLLGGFTDSQIANLVGRFNGRPSQLLDRITTLGPALLAWFVGGGQVETSLPLPDRPWVTWLAAAGLLAAIVRLAVLVASPAASRRAGSWLAGLRTGIAAAPFAWYLFGVGAVAIVAFVAGKPILTGYSRYAILGLLVPIGVTAAMLTLEPRPAVRRGVMTLVIAWGAVAAADHVRILAADLTHPPEHPARDLASALVARHIPSAAAGYWRAYVVTFLARERVQVASTDFVRVQEYQDLFSDRLKDSVYVEDHPCPGSAHVAKWYLCPP